MFSKVQFGMLVLCRLRIDVQNERVFSRILIQQIYLLILTFMKEFKEISMEKNEFECRENQQES